MAGDRTVSLSFRVTPSFARLLDQAAALENRSKTNLVETLVVRFCRERGIALDDDTVAEKPTGSSPGLRAQATKATALHDPKNPKTTR